MHDSLNDIKNRDNLTRYVDTNYYEAIQPNSMAEYLAICARDRIYDDFVRICRPRRDNTILDIGASDVTGQVANVLERRYPYSEQITAVGLGAAEGFRAAFPRVTYRQIEPNRSLPFADQSFDIVTSNAVLEHTGSLENQRRLIMESMRVGNRVFLTVPCRFFPIEHHTAIPLLHWTDASFAFACHVLGKNKWSRPENLILMSRRRLRAACPAGARVEIGATGILLGPCSANLYLYIERQDIEGQASP